MKLTIFVIFLGFVLVFAGFSFGSQEKESMEETDGKMEMSAEDSGRIIDFTTLEDARMTAAEGAAVLFFSAGWCPTCREATADIASRLDELRDITVIVLDYDTEKELKAMYNVTYQHTFVAVDSQGELVRIWQGGDLEKFVRNTSDLL